MLQEDFKDVAFELHRGHNEIGHIESIEGIYEYEYDIKVYDVTMGSEDFSALESSKPNVASK